MDKRGIPLLLLLQVSLVTQAQVVNMGGSSSGTAEGYYTDDQIKKSTVRLLTIGIGHFDNFDNLESYSILNGFDSKEVSDNITHDYKNFDPVFLNKKRVRTEEVITALETLDGKTKSDDLVIISFQLISK